MTSALVEIEAVSVSFRRRGWRSQPLRVLHDVSLSLARGETVGLVGESGSGKSTLGRAILGLAPLEAGTIRIDGVPVVSGSHSRSIAALRQAVFQDPYTSLNPALSVGAILSEPLRVQGTSSVDARRRVTELLDRVSLPAGAADRLPHEFSGGQRQRIAIARALALQPKVIVCDEPVSALDLSTQALIIDLLIEVQRDSGVAYLFITHDLAVVRAVSHRVAVMQGGRIVEQGSATNVTERPEHPYTQRLLLSSPVQDPDEQAIRRQELHSVRAGSL